MDIFYRSMPYMFVNMYLLYCPIYCISNLLQGQIHWFQSGFIKLLYACVSFGRGINAKDPCSATRIYKLFRFIDEFKWSDLPPLTILELIAETCITQIFGLSFFSQIVRLFHLYIFWSLTSSFKTQWNRKMKNPCQKIYTIVSKLIY